jgi:PAP2 superfamily C-terminal
MEQKILSRPFLEAILSAWRDAWNDIRFRRQFSFFSTATVLILGILPFFFDFIEARQGTLLSDWVIAQIPARDFSIGIFGILWGSGLLILVRALQQPRLMLLFFAGYVALTLARMFTILVFPLEPPVGLIVLQDPISNQFYGDHFITKDLFFSGHTSAVFLISYCLTKPFEKKLVLFGGFLVGVMVILQHVHYTIDAVAAPPLTYLCYQIGKWWVKQ